jgi:hypothetical protein
MIPGEANHQKIAKVSLIQYVKSSKYYLFVFSYGIIKEEDEFKIKEERENTIFFCRKRIDDVEALNCNNGSKQSLLYDNT